MSQYKIAVIPGDGIGTEVMPEGIRVMDAAARRFGIDFQWDHFDFSSYAYYERHGKMLPDDWFDTLTRYDAIYFGAVGWPAKIPDHVVFDAALNYDLGKISNEMRGATFALNVSNLFDKHFISDCTAAGCVYGMRRTVFATLGYKW